MLLTELAEVLRDHLNSAPEKWTEESGIVVKVELDPMVCYLNNFGVYIIPNFFGFAQQGNRPRQDLVHNNEMLYCSLIVSKQFTDIPADSTDGVADWEEVKPMINTWQRATHFLRTFTNDQVTLVDSEAQQPEQLEMDYRNFVSITAFTFEQVVCDSQHELSSSSIAFTEGSKLGQIRAFIRSQPSSD